MIIQDIHTLEVCNQESVAIFRNIFFEEKEDILHYDITSDNSKSFRLKQNSIASFCFLSLKEYTELPFENIFKEWNANMITEFIISTFSLVIDSSKCSSTQQDIKYEVVLEQLEYKSNNFKKSIICILVGLFKRNECFKDEYYKSIIIALFSLLSKEEQLFFHMFMIMGFEDYSSEIDYDSYRVLQDEYIEYNGRIFDYDDLEILANKLDEITRDLTDKNISYLTHRYGKGCYKWILSLVGRELTYKQLSEINNYQAKINVSQLSLWLCSIDENTKISPEFSDDPHILTNYLKYLISYYIKDYRFLFTNDDVFSYMLCFCKKSINNCDISDKMERLSNFKSICIYCDNSYYDIKPIYQEYLSKHKFIPHYLLERYRKLFNTINTLFFYRLFCFYPHFIL